MGQKNGYMVTQNNRFLSKKTKSKTYGPYRGVLLTHLTVPFRGEIANPNKKNIEKRGLFGQPAQSGGPSFLSISFLRLSIRKLCSEKLGDPSLILSWRSPSLAGQGGQEKAHAACRPRESSANIELLGVLSCLKSLKTQNEPDFSQGCPQNTKQYGKPMFMVFHRFSISI